MAIRSGRFKAQLASTDKIRIVLGRTGAFYRVFNSGKNAFNVTSGTSDPTTLKEGDSLDVDVDDEVIITAPIAAYVEEIDEVYVEGIYDYVDMPSPIRSGRFKIKNAPAEPHKIIDLSHSGHNRRAFYRILNSGDENPFNVVVDGVPYPDPNEGLKPNQSFDFEVGKSKRDISVAAIADKYPIEGIYEFLGAED